MREEDKYGGFDVRDLNVLKITNIADATIALAECNYVLKEIEGQLAEKPFRKDRDWETQARRAMTEVEHKKNMVLIKKAHIEERDANNKKSLNPDQNFSSRFVKAAQNMLSDETFIKIQEMAKELGRRLD
jgi:hypothetical protein